MSLPRFDYVAPRSVSRAISLQRKGGRFIAGGTDLLVALKEKRLNSGLLVDLKGIPRLRGVRRTRQGAIRIGALTTLTQFKESPLIRRRLPSLGAVVPLIGTPQLQNMGTLGGNLCLDTRCLYYNQPWFLNRRREPCYKMGGGLCHAVRGGKGCYAVCCSDMSAPLIALGAKVTIAGPDAKKQIGLERLYTGDGSRPNILAFNELLAEIIIPPMAGHCGLSYQKLRLRETFDFPLAGVAVFLKLEDSRGRCEDLRLVLGAVSPSPVVVGEAAGAAKGKPLDNKLIEEISRLALESAHPVSNTASTAAYRKRMVRVLTKRALQEASGRARARSSA